VGTQPVDEYCREIETYLCRKNDGHLIRVVGPSFEVVSGWADQGVPLKVAFSGIDRYFERYYRKGARAGPSKSISATPTCSTSSTNGSAPPAW
jgi:hypothetical protein